MLQEDIDFEMGMNTGFPAVLKGLSKLSNTFMDGDETTRSMKLQPFSEIIDAASDVFLKQLNNR